MTDQCPGCGAPLRVDLGCDYCGRPAQTATDVYVTDISTFRTTPAAETPFSTYTYPGTKELLGLRRGS